MFKGVRDWWLRWIRGKKTNYDDGGGKEEQFYRLGILHRDQDKPAVIVYDTLGNVIYEEWWKKGHMLSWRISRSRNGSK